MTFAEVQQAVGANPALLTEIAQGFGKDILPIIGGNDDLIKGLVPVIAQKGYTVRDKASEDSFLATFKNQIIETEIPTRVKEVHDRYDEDLYNLTGERKAHSEKTYDFLKRKIAEIKSQGISDPVVKEQLKTLQAQLETKENEFKKQLTDVESKYFGREIDLLISGALDKVNISIPGHLKTDEEKQRYMSLQKNMMKTDMLNGLTAKKDNDGNIVFYNGDKPLTSTTDGKALRPLDIINERYSYYIAKDDPRRQGGAGTGGAGGGGTAFATKEEVIAHIEKSGIKQGTQEFYAQYEKLCKESGLLKK